MNFFDTMDAVAVSRYLPALVYQKGKPENTAYVGCAMESYEKDLGKFWPPELDLGATGSLTTAERALGHIKKLSGVRRVGVESGFIPADAEGVIRQGLSNVEVVDAVNSEVVLVDIRLDGTDGNAPDPISVFGERRLGR